MKNNRRFVVDTNLFISAAIWQGTPYQGIKSIVLSGGRFVFSQDTLQELEPTLLASKFDPYVDRAERLATLSLYVESSDIVAPEQHFTHCRDPKDNAFLDVAVAGNVEALITGDKDLLVLNTIEGIPIIRMGDFLET
jgi:putative PIN family toxin of toxin-antitoxin system